MNQPVLCSVCSRTIEWCKTPDHDFTPGLIASLPWVRYTFSIAFVHNFEPIKFDPHYPWWSLPVGTFILDGHVVIIAYLPTGELLTDYWPDANNVQMHFCGHIVFSDKFPKPDWFVES